MRFPITVFHLKEIIRGLLKGQKFQATESWTRHTLLQRAVVVTEVSSYARAKFLVM